MQQILIRGRGSIGNKVNDTLREQNNFAAIKDRRYNPLKADADDGEESGGIQREFWDTLP